MNIKDFRVVEGSSELKYSITLVYYCVNYVSKVLMAKQATVCSCTLKIMYSQDPHSSKSSGKLPYK